MKFPMPYIEYCAMTRPMQILYKFLDFFRRLGLGIYHFFVGIGLWIYNFAIKFGKSCKKLYLSFKYGDWATKLSFLFLGTSHIKRGQYVKGIMMMILEGLFIFFMVIFGGQAIHDLITLGTFQENFYCKDNPSVIFPSEEAAYEGGCFFPEKLAPDNSPKMLLYGILTVLILVTFIVFYFKSIRASYELQNTSDEGRHVNSFKEDMSAFLNSKFHITLLALPITGVLLFSILPLIDMICMAFTNYDFSTNYPIGCFDWVGLANFKQLFVLSNNENPYVYSFGYTFAEIFKWTILWAVLATISNFIIGIFIASIINRKSIKFKKFWRTCLVLSVAIPQFVSLLAISQLLTDNGPLLTIMRQWGWVDTKFTFLNRTYTEYDFLGLTMHLSYPRLLVLLINVWIGVPYTVLSTTGILMNVPEDLYESARIDGASAWTMYFKITLRYIVFVMGPSLITTFIGNVNNFGVIYLLTGGGPGVSKYYGHAGHTDLLVTWLFNLTQGTDPDYKMASVIGIVIFVISATFSLIVYHNSSSFKNEEDFA